MQTAGSALIRMMQNPSEPKLDLFVRESLQNSMDAALLDAESVDVSFNTGEFKKELFASAFDDLQFELATHFSEAVYSFLSVRDTNTVGLTGVKTGLISSDDKDEHLGKLVFQIMHPQRNEGAGGSWGIGKTVYYRLGAGFTVYYSRIKISGGFEERLVASFVEDETKKDGILKQFSNNIGVAFFGQFDGTDEEEFSVICNEEKIHSFLKIFNLAPFTDEQTGTLIIVPFINEKELLDNNKKDASSQGAYWYQSIPSFLEISVMKWYFPRINPDYFSGAKLNVSINGKVVNPNAIPIFHELSNLYSSIASYKRGNGSNETEISLNNIKTREVRKSGSNFIHPVLGWFAFRIISNSEAGLDLKYPSPLIYFGIDQPASEDEGYSPIIMYTRRPGMIASYRANDDWTGTRVNSGKDNFIIGLFVLNSENAYFGINLTLEEYVRRGEKSDHFDWYDSTIDKLKNKKGDAISHIKRVVKKCLQEAFIETPKADEEATVNRILGKKFAKALLPDNLFGKESTINGKTGREEIRVAKSKSTLVTLLMDNGRFEGEFINITFKVESKKKGTSINFVPQIATTRGYRSMADWIEQDQMVPPFEILSLTCVLEDSEGRYLGQPVIEIFKDSTIFEKSLSFEFEKKEQLISSIRLVNNSFDKFVCRVNLKARIIDRNFNCAFHAIVIEGE